MRKSRRQPAEEPANHDRWLVSYSDLITTLFACFVVLFATSYRDSKSIEGVSKSIHNGFQTLGAFSKDPSGDGAYSTPTGAPSPSAQQNKAQQSNASGAPPIDINELQKQLAGAIGQEIKKHEVETRVTPEGFVVSLKELGFFSSGQATLMPGAAEKIARIAKVLALHGLDMRIEGHSDDRPIHTAEFRSNWELSTARATAVLLLIVNDSGYDPRKISVAGYGEYRPIANNATPEGRAINRRVDIVVVQTAAAPTPAPAGL